MTDLSKDAISHKGKKIKKYSLSFKKEVIAYAEMGGNRPASKQFLVDERRIREWRINKNNIEGLLEAVKGKQRSRLSGGGRKPLSVKLEEVLLEWIESERARGLQVSCKLIMKKAEITYRDMMENNIVDGENFKASRGWLRKFLKRNSLSNSLECTNLDVKEAYPPMMELIDSDQEGAVTSKSSEDLKNMERKNDYSR